MRRWRKRRRARPFVGKACLALLAVGAIAAYGKFGSIHGVLDAAASWLLAREVVFTMAESAPVGSDCGEAKRTDTPAESANLFGRDTHTADDKPPYTPEIRNDTSFLLDLDALEASGVSIKDSEEPQVLIVHTHTSEAYTPDEEYSYVQDDNDRTLNEQFNVVAVGNRVEQLLKDAGISVIHDKTLNDYPSYSGSYSRMLEIIELYLAEYPSIRVVLDIHRDAVIYEDGSRFAASTVIDGKSAAQVMLVVGTNEGGLPHDGWEQNLAFALDIQSAADALYPGLMRPVNLRSSRFNQHVSPGALIVEVGASGNTLGEALYGAELFAKALMNTLK